jgi:hypothetical protein
VYDGHFQLSEEGAAEEATDDDESVSAFSQWVLPAVEFQVLLFLKSANMSFTCQRVYGRVFSSIPILSPIC